MLNNVLYADLTGVFLVVGCTLFISLVNCLSEIPTMELKLTSGVYDYGTRTFLIPDIYLDEVLIN